MTERGGCVIIPAHDEANVIERSLVALLGDAQPGEFDVIVVANGCADDTAEIAGRFADRGVRVIETATAGKVPAINLAGTVARHEPCLVLDADVELQTSGARAMFDALSAAPAVVANPTLDLAGCTLPARQYWLAWRSRNPSPTSGTGCYGLSRESRIALGSLPEVTGDDEYIARRFETTRVLQAVTRIYPARTLRAVLRRRIRIEQGNAQAARVMPGRPAPAVPATRGSAPVPGSLLLVAVHVTARGMAQLGLFAAWKSDTSSRAAASSTSKRVPPRRLRQIQAYRQPDSWSGR